MDALLFGALALLIARLPDVLKRLRPFLLPIFFGSVLATLGVMLLTRTHWSNRSGYMQTVGYSMTALGFAALLLWVFCLQEEARHHRFVGFLNSWPLQRVGIYSYGMYLYHPLLMTALAWAFSKVYPGPLSYLYIVVTLACTFGVAAVSFHTYERYFTRKKRFFEYEARSSGPVALR